MQRNYMNGSVHCSHGDAFFSLRRCLFQHVFTFSAMSARYCSSRNNEEDRAPFFTMTKSTEETLHQVRHVQDVVACLKKDDCCRDKLEWKCPNKYGSILCKAMGKVDSTSAGSLTPVTRIKLHAAPWHLLRRKKQEG